MAINTNLLVASKALSQPFVDKNSGLPLAGGLVFFWQQDNPTTPKVVYARSDDPDAPTFQDGFVELPNPITLNMAGQLCDNNGNIVLPYAYPYDANEDIQLYLVQVYAAPNPPFGGIFQYQIEYWPPFTPEEEAPNEFVLESNDAVLAPGFTYVCNAGEDITPLRFSLPATAQLGDTYRIIGVPDRNPDVPSNGRGWKVVVTGTQRIQLGTMLTTLTTGYLQSSQPSDCITIFCTGNDNDYFTAFAEGNILVN
jgi:hypothetical protein